VRGRLVFFSFVAFADMSGVAFAPQASAEQTRPPDVVLHTGVTHQEGRLGSYCWAYSTGNGTGVGVCADATRSWPPAKEARRADPASILIHRRERPRELDLSAWRKVDPDTAEPIGPSRRVQFTLHPRFRNGERVAWTADFTLSRSPGHYYLNMFARWSPGDASYRFHLRLG
jgi:hypothetical protein